MARIRHTIEFIGLLLLIVAVITSAFFLAEFISTNETMRALVEQYGIFGMIAVAFVGGLNLILPVPAASFTPIFTTAGFSLFTIVSSLVVGTILADLLGFQIGKWGSRSTRAHFPKFHDWLVSLRRDHHGYILPGVFLFAAFMPMPNEAMLVPLGLMGYHYWTIAAPLLLGTIVNQTIYTLGFLGIFDMFF